MKLDGYLRLAAEWAVRTIWDLVRCNTLAGREQKGLVSEPILEWGE